MLVQEVEFFCCGRSWKCTHCLLFQRLNGKQRLRSCMTNMSSRMNATFQDLPAWGSRWVCMHPLLWRGRQSPVEFCSSDRGWVAPSPRWWCSGTPGLPAQVHRHTEHSLRLQSVLQYGTYSIQWLTCCSATSPDVSSPQVNSSESVTSPNGFRSMSHTLPCDTHEDTYYT